MKGDTIYIPLTRDKEAIVDARDFPRISKHSWCVDSGGYAIGWHAGKLIRMHRLIMRARKGQLVDHINRNKLDNRRANLRFASPTLNVLNSKRRTDNASGTRGVWWDKLHQRWYAMIQTNGKRLYLGCFQEKRHAIRAVRDGNKSRIIL